MEKSSVDYVRQRLMASVSILVGPGEMRERLRYADNYEVVHAYDNRERVPPDIKQALESLHQRMTTVEPNGEEGRIAATVNAMTDDEAADVAREIVNLTYRMICLP